MDSLKGKVAIVTGGASGIGRTAALLMAGRGAQLVISDVSEEAGRQAVEAIEQAGGQAVYRYADVRSAEECVGLVECALGRFGQLDIAFNNAGIAGATSLTEDQGLELWRRVIDVNLTGVFNCMVPQLRAMKARGGAIVNTASIAGVGGAAGAAAYSASKHGVIGLTRTAALEYAKHGIRINSVSPGYISTPMTVGEESIFQQSMLERAVAGAPMRRLGRAEEIAETVLWLCSDKASYVTGANFIVDGGVSASC